MPPNNGWSELVVHIAVHGGDDIGVVMGYTLLLKKIERVVIRRRTFLISLKTEFRCQVLPISKIFDSQTNNFANVCRRC